MNSNSFSGRIPNSIGNLSKLFWLDLGENKLTGTLPMSNGTTPGLDTLVNTKHFHLGRNQLSGSVPPQLLHENMTILHLRLDWNSISGSVPSNISNLTSLTDMLLSNNQLTGPMPDLTGVNSLSYLDISNNSFEAWDFPSWINGLSSLTDLIMEKTQIQGMVPDSLFILPHLQQVILKKNGLDGRLDIGAAHSTELRIIDVQSNNISAYTHRPGPNSFQLILVENPVCHETSELQSYCGITKESKPPYTTPQDCVPIACSENEFSSPNCKCANPYSGNFVFRAPRFSNLQNFTYYTALEKKLVDIFQFYKLPVDSVSLSNISRNASNYVGITLQIFPLDQGQFNRTSISILGFLLSNQTFKPPPIYGTFYLTANEYTIFADEQASGQEKALSMAAIIGLVARGSLIMLILLCAGIISCYCRKRPAESEEPNYPLGLTPVSLWSSSGSNSSPLQLSGSRLFTLDEVKKITDNFAKANDIGSGAFGKVYKGILVDGRLVDVKRANHGSRHSGNQFEAEIELLTQVHHTNLVRLLGFCLEKGELIVVYEYVPNGNLKESLTGKSGVRLDWKRRIKVTLGTARGLAYLHQLASLPIVHRDIKSNNILLDENLNAKLSDFGLSKPLSEVGKGYITTEVKGTMGYLDPEYYYTQKLNEKSDVHSIGVLMLEVIIGKSPLVRRKYIVNEVKNLIDRTQDLYGLHEVLDSGISLSSSLKGFEKYVNLAMRCVEESRTNRPDMGEVVKQLEDILEMAELISYSNSGGSSPGT